LVKRLNASRFWSLFNRTSTTIGSRA
jgi:hypothetical protein